MYAKACQYERCACGLAYLYNRFRRLRREAIVQAFITELFPYFTKLVPLWYLVVHCWVNIVVAPMHLPNLEGELHMEVSKDFICPGTSCQACLTCLDPASFGCCDQDLQVNDNAWGKRPWT